MKLYLNCASGISGDMFTAALLDLGLPLEGLRSGLDGLELDFEVKTWKTYRSHVASTRFEVSCGKQEKHRFLPDILDLIDGSGLEKEVKEMSCRVFSELGRAESEVHGCALEEVHFHEVGAVDSIVDVVSACVLLKKLGVSGFYSGPVAVGSGSICIEGHGQVSLPAPATKNLLRDFRIEQTNTPCELTTPTGAALIKTFCLGMRKRPEGFTKKGCGAGMRDNEKANVLEAYLC